MCKIKCGFQQGRPDNDVLIALVILASVDVLTNRHMSVNHRALQYYLESSNSAATPALSRRQQLHSAAAPSVESKYIVESRYVNGSGQVIVDPHPAPDQQQKLTTSRVSPLARAYRVWSVSVTAFMSYRAHRQNDRTNDHITPPALAEL